MTDEEVFGPDDDLPDWVIDVENGVPEDEAFGPDAVPGTDVPFDEALGPIS